MILNDWEGHCSLMLNNLTKMTQKGQCNRFCLTSIGVRSVWRILVSIKKFGKYKKLPSDKFVK